jgi:hypothetical protein
MRLILWTLRSGSEQIHLHGPVLHIRPGREGAGNGPDLKAEGVRPPTGWRTGKRKSALH